MHEEPEPDSPFREIRLPPKSDPVEALKESQRQQRHFRVQLLMFHTVSVILVVLTTMVGVGLATGRIDILAQPLAMGLVGALIGLVLSWVVGVFGLGLLLAQQKTSLWMTSLPNYMIQGAAQMRLWTWSSMAGLIGTACGAVIGEIKGLESNEPIHAPNMEPWLFGGAMLGLSLSALLGFFLLRSKHTTAPSNVSDGES
jgi:hypothetical protein